MNVAGLDSEASDAMSCRTADIGDRFEVGRISVQDCGAVMRQKKPEESKLGVEIGRFGLVIVEMVTAQVGERRSGKPNAIQAILIEAMRGGLQCKILRQRESCLGFVIPGK